MSVFENPTWLLFFYFFGKHEIPYSIVLTKIDKTSKIELKLLKDLIIKNLATQRFFDKNILEVSSKKNSAIDLLRADVYLTFFKDQAQNSIKNQDS